MTNNREGSQPTVGRGNQRVADILTLICMGTTGILVLFAIFGPSEGMEAMVILFPWLFAVAAHAILRRPSLLLAWKTNHHWRNFWIYGYFIIFWGFHTVYFTPPARRMRP